MRSGSFAALLAIASLAVLTPTAGADESAASVEARRILSGLSQPLDVVFAPDDAGTMYIVERAGRIRMARAGKVQAPPFLDVRSWISHVGPGNERGLLALAFANDFATSRKFFISYSDRNQQMRVVELSARGGTGVKSSGKALLGVSQKPFASWHFAGDLAVGRDGMLYISTGDGGYWRQPGVERKKHAPLEADPYGNSQNLAVLNGKILRLDVGGDRAEPTTVAYGLRNPWRFSLDRATQDIWIGDVGFDHVEEVDGVRAGAALVNFGWSVYEGRRRRDYRGKPPPLDPTGDLTWPFFSYRHSDGNCSIIGGYVYRGTRVPSLRGRYVFGDYCSGRIWSIPRRGAHGAARLERARVPHLTSFGEDPGGELYATSATGDVYQLVAG